MILLWAMDEEARATKVWQWTTVTFFCVHYLSSGEGLSQMIRLRYRIGCFEMSCRTLTMATTTALTMTTTMTTFIADHMPGTGSLHGRWKRGQERTFFWLLLLLLVLTVALIDRLLLLPFPPVHRELVLTQGRIRRKWGAFSISFYG